jgi:hypothetical protein
VTVETGMRSFGRKQIINVHEDSKDIFLLKVLSLGEFYAVFRILGL